MDSQVNASNDDALNINSLPDEVISKIFHYLTQNQLGQIARVCRRWDVLAWSPLLWKKVYVEIFLQESSYRSPTAITKSFINKLPSCVTSIRLFFLYTWTERLDFVELCAILQKKCPHLEALILINIGLSVNFSSVIDLCTQFLQEVKKLVFCDCVFPFECSIAECGGISKIEILHVIIRKYHDCWNGLDCNKHPFSRMPCLKELRVEFANIDDSWFEDDTSFFNQLCMLILSHTDITSRTFSAIKNHGHNLKELCLSQTFSLQDQDLKFNNSVFPQLKTICLPYCDDVTCEGVVSLIQSCPSLQTVFVNKDVAESFSEHPFVVANGCKTGIVKAAVDIDHDSEVRRYMGNIRY